MNVKLSLKDPTKPLPHHISHDPILKKILRYDVLFWHIKERITNEIELCPSTIFEQEIKKLQTIHGVSKLAIANYAKPYAHYKSGFESRRRPVSI